MSSKLGSWVPRGVSVALPICALSLGAITLAAEDASDRPDESAMFGGSNTPSVTASPVPVAPRSGPEKELKAEGHDVKELKPSGSDAFASGDVVDNPLQIGGKYYQRFLVSGQKGGGVGGAPLSAPLQFDGFLDARPNDRLRSFVDARLFYDATRDSFSRSTGQSQGTNLQFSSASSAPSSFSGTVATPNNPQVSLDQAWLKFDLDRTVFATIGKQHVKWGAARFWNPTDFLHVQRRDPLLPYDLRLGNSMAKFELPWEGRRANLYAVVLFDNPQPASTLGQLGGALRAEKVWGDLEVGLDLVARGGRRTAYGADASTSLGPLDVYFEGALLGDAPAPRYQVASALVPGADISTLVSEVPTTGPYVQVSGGASHTFGWRENRQATLGIEYFYNQAGNTDAAVYPALIFYGQFQPFYTGRHYAAIYLTAEGPDAEKRTSYTLTTLANASDKSLISRLDFSWRVLTYLTFESYADAHYGTQGGEFNFAFSTPSLVYRGTQVAAVDIPDTVFDLGLGFRISF